MTKIFTLSSETVAALWLDFNYFNPVVAAYGFEDEGELDELIEFELEALALECEVWLDDPFWRKWADYE